LDKLGCAEGGKAKTRGGGSELRKEEGRFGPPNNFLGKMETNLKNKGESLDLHAQRIKVTRIVKSARMDKSNWLNKDKQFAIKQKRGEKGEKDRA